MTRIVTVLIGGPDTPVLVQGEFIAEEKGLTSVRLSDSVIVRGRPVPSVRIDNAASSSV